MPLVVFVNQRVQGSNPSSEYQDGDLGNTLFIIYTAQSLVGPHFQSFEGGHMGGHLEILDDERAFKKVSLGGLLQALGFKKR